MTVRATTTEVLTRVRAALDADARTAAGNAQLSKTEQMALAPGVLRDAAVAVRGRAGRVNVDELVLEADHLLTALLGGVNVRGPSAVSQEEVRALHAVNADAGARVAHAYELLTGKHIDLPGITTTPVPPSPPPAAGQAPIQAFTQNPTPVMPFAGPTTLVSGGALQVVRGAAVPSTFTLDVGGRTFTATIDGSERMSGRVSNVATPADVVEAIRNAVAPALHVHVRQHDSAGTVLELYGAPPPPPALPTYLYVEARSAAGAKLYHGIELRGPLRWVVANGATLQSGDSLSLRVDDKVFTATATRPNQSIRGLVRSLRDQAVAAGRTVDLREYTNYAPWTFTITG